MTTLDYIRLAEDSKQAYDFSAARIVALRASRDRKGLSCFHMQWSEYDKAIRKHERKMAQATKDYTAAHIALGITEIIDIALPIDEDCMG